MALAMTPMMEEMQAALQLIDEGFNKPGWHGPNLSDQPAEETRAKLTSRTARRVSEGGGRPDTMRG